MSKTMERLKQIKTVTVRGKRYRFKVRKLKDDTRGLTDPPSLKGKTVSIDSREQGKELLATLIDELLHCACWDIGNDSVDEMSDGLSDFLWDRCNLRFADDLEWVEVGSDDSLEE